MTEEEDGGAASTTHCAKPRLAYLPTVLFEWETARWIAAVAAGVTLAAWFADRRRMRRRDPDAVGWMPWTSVFFLALMHACVFGALAFQGWVRG